MRDEDCDVRICAAAALGRIGDERAVEALLEALKDKSSHVRWRAVKMLALIKPEALVKGLLRAMFHENSFVRKKAASVIGYYSCRQNEEKLKLLAEDDPDLEVKQAAQNAITRLQLKKKYFDHIAYNN